MSSYSREYLLSLPEEYRQETISSTIKHLWVPTILSAARQGKTSYMVNLKDYLNQSKNYVGCYPPTYSPTVNDLVEGFQKMYYDCRVEYTEDWIETKPGVREQIKGILVDWS